MSASTNGSMISAKSFDMLRGIASICTSPVHATRSKQHSKSVDAVAIDSLPCAEEHVVAAYPRTFRVTLQSRAKLCATCKRNHFLHGDSSTENTECFQRLELRAHCLCFDVFGGAAHVYRD